MTNSIRHGNGDLVNIDIKYDESKLIVRIRDNGIDCKHLIKGNGLLGIEDRVAEFGGEVNYNFKDKDGFEVNIIFVWNMIL